MTIVWKRSCSSLPIHKHQDLSKPSVTSLVQHHEIFTMMHDAIWRCSCPACRICAYARQTKASPNGSPPFRLYRCFFHLNSRNKDGRWTRQSKISLHSRKKSQPLLGIHRWAAQSAAHVASRLLGPRNEIWPLSGCKPIQHSGKRFVCFLSQQAWCSLGSAVPMFWMLLQGAATLPVPPRASALGSHVVALLTCERISYPITVVTYHSVVIIDEPGRRSWCQRQRAASRPGKGRRHRCSA